MKATQILSCAVFILLSSSVILISRGEVITFDDVPTGRMTVSNSGTMFTFLPLVALTNGYQGFNWSNFLVFNSPLNALQFGNNGYHYGMVSASNVAFNSDGALAEIDSASVDFNFLSVYLTGAWNSNLNIEVQGFSGTNLLYDTTVAAGATNSTLFTFDYLGIDRLTFNSFGGQSAGFPNGGGEAFAMDNFDFEFVPEPSSLLLAGFAALALWPFLKRKRV